MRIRFRIIPLLVVAVSTDSPKHAQSLIPRFHIFTRIIVKTAKVTIEATIAFCGAIPHSKNIASEISASGIRIDNGPTRGEGRRFPITALNCGRDRIFEIAAIMKIVASRRIMAPDMVNED